jgi:hypothetical protein
MMQVSVQCEKCGKWTELPSTIVPSELPDQFFCSLGEFLFG